MTLLFRRDYELIAKQIGVFEDTIKIKDLQIVFEVDKSIDSGINSGTVTVFNLQESYRKFLAQDNVEISLSAGHIGDVPEIFSGEVELCVPVLNGRNWETELQVRDGAKQLRITEADESFKKKTPKRKLFDFLIGQLTKQQQQNVAPLAKGSIDLSTVTGNLVKGRSLRGNCFDNLYKLCREFGLDLFVTDGKLNITQPQRAILQDRTRLSHTSGLIGTPEITDKGVKCYALLQRGLDPGMVFDLDSDTAQGSFYVKNAKYKGTYRNSNDWYIEIEAITQNG